METEKLSFDIKPEHHPFLYNTEDRNASHCQRCQISSHWRGRMKQMLCVSTALNLLLFFISVVVSTTRLSNNFNNFRPFPTDLRNAWPAIEYEVRNFTGALRYNPEDARMFRVQDYDTEYFGPPSKEIDAAWEELVRGEWPVMREDEAAPFQPELRKIPLRGKTPHFYFEPDFFHSLHCINRIRSEFTQILYNASTSRRPGSGAATHTQTLEDRRTHTEHCLDRLRQNVMCQADLTPSPMYYWDGWNVALGRSGEHTCRKWEPIRAWMDERGKAGTM